MSAGLMYFEDVSVGDEPQPFVRKTELVNFNRFAAVNDEFVMVHMDNEAAKTNGFPRLYGMGALRKALFHTAVREWIGETGDLLRLVVQHRAPNFRDETLTIRGVVSATAADDQTVEIKITAVTDEGTVSGKGSAVVRLPTRG